MNQHSLQDDRITFSAIPTWLKRTGILLDPQAMICEHHSSEYVCDIACKQADARVVLIRQKVGS